MATISGLSIAASGGQDGSAPDQFSYVKLRSDRSGHEVRWTFKPTVTAARFNGLVTLANHDDYRLILGTDAGTTVEVQSLAIVAEGRTYGFDTHDERRSWECAGDSRPTSWGARGATSFGGLVTGPTAPGWGLRNRHLALLERTRYRMRFDALGVRGTARSAACFVRAEDLAGASVAEHRWDFVAGGSVRREEFIFDTGGAPPKTITFGIDHDASYVVGDLLIEPA